MQYRYVLCSGVSMDKTREALAQADKHVIESRQRIAKQQALVKQLERDGHDSSMAKALLQEFRHSLQLHLIGRATMEAEIARTRSDRQSTEPIADASSVRVSDPAHSDKRA